MRMRHRRPSIRQAGVGRYHCRALHRSGQHLPRRGDLRELAVGDGCTGGDVGIDDAGDGAQIDEFVELLRGDEFAVGEGFAFGESGHG